MGKKSLRLIKDANILDKWYKKGHLFEIVGEDNLRGLDIKDEDGKIIYETRMINDLFEKI